MKMRHYVNHICLVSPKKCHVFMKSMHLRTFMPLLMGAGTYTAQRGHITTQAKHVSRLRCARLLLTTWLSQRPAGLWTRKHWNVVGSTDLEGRGSCMDCTPGCAFHAEQWSTTQPKYTQIMIWVPPDHYLNRAKRKESWEQGN